MSIANTRFPHFLLFYFFSLSDSRVYYTRLSKSCVTVTQRMPAINIHFRITKTGEIFEACSIDKTGSRFKNDYRRTEDRNTFSKNRRNSICAIRKKREVEKQRTRYYHRRNITQKIASVTSSSLVNYRELLIIIRSIKVFTIIVGRAVLGTMMQSLDGPTLSVNLPRSN